MPSTLQASKEEIVNYESARRLFLERPDPACIPLLLNSFGQGDLFGIYQLVPDVICKFRDEDVIPHLVVALKSPHSSVQYWAPMIALHFPSEVLIRPLTELLESSETDIRDAAASALGMIKDE